MTADEYKQFKGLRKESLRDNMSDIKVALADLGELATRKIANKRKPNGLEENKEVAKIGGSIAKNTRDNLERELGESIVSNENKLSYTYSGHEKLLEE